MWETSALLLPWRRTGRRVELCLCMGLPPVASSTDCDHPAARVLPTRRCGWDSCTRGVLWGASAPPTEFCSTWGWGPAPSSGRCLSRCADWPACCHSGRGCAWGSGLQTCPPSSPCGPTGRPICAPVARSHGLRPRSHAPRSASCAAWRQLGGLSWRPQGLPAPAAPKLHQVSRPFATPHQVWRGAAAARARRLPRAQRELAPRAAAVLRPLAWLLRPPR